MDVHDHVGHDIENQQRSLTGVRASTSFSDLGQEASKEVSSKKEQNDLETEDDVESQTTGDRRHGYLRDQEVRPPSDVAGHSGENAQVHFPDPPPLPQLDLSHNTQPGDSREETSTHNRSIRKERNSWDFEADDTFKFESGGAIPEPGKPPDPPPIFTPPFVRNPNDVRAKLMHLSEGPTSPPASGAEDAEPPGGLFADDSEQPQQEVSLQETVVGDAPLFCVRKKPPRPITRPKTRLQDPPPMVSAVSDQLASLRSETASNGTRAPVVVQRLDEEGQSSSLASVVASSGRRVSLTISGAEGEQLQRLQSRKSILINGNESAGNPIVEKPPERIGSRLGMFSPSVIFSGSRLRLLSRSKASIQQPAPAPPPPEEEDPLADDSIPRYKKRYRSKHTKWLTWIQWISLCILIVILVLAVKLNKLQVVIWKDIQLWQWLALATVIISGRLIAGWLVMIMVAMIERHYILKKRVLYFVYGLRHAVKNVVWLALVIGVWKLVFRHVESEGNIPIVTKVLWCLFTTACLWMVKILAVKVAANSFHRAAYFDRVQDCLFHQYVLETLSAPRGAPEETDELSVEPKGPTQARQELEALLHPDVLLDPHSSSDVKSTEGPPVSSHLESKLSPEPVKLPIPGKSHLNAVLDQCGEMRHESHISSGVSRSNLGRGSSVASGSRVNLTGTMSSPTPGVSVRASSSRTNMRSSNSRLALASPTGSRLRRVTGPDDQPSSSVSVRTTSPIQQEKLQELTAETVSAWTMKRLMKIIRKTNIATFSSILDQEVGEKIDSEAQAKAAAKQIFYNIARPGEKYLTLTDFLYFLPEDQATRAFALFEVNDLGQITKKSLMKWVVNIYKERRALALTLSDNRTVVAKLHRVLDVLLFVIAITICFLIMGVNTQKLIVGFSSVLLPSVFVFGNAARSTFESLLFLFVMHPFDVGDRICVDGNAMIVEVST
ncbi:hypothetical protein R1sor_000209 [Riccia sorocarpa]|uniref:Mechanosensitive ion channel protein n=1 Tax=Riccia sorocarpa TaxID=122646 RepID=A0ABD3GSG2_9MARC